MGFWIFLTVCNLLIPLVMLAAGYMMEEHTPKTVNGFYGYRTSMSMKNEETWKFAHSCCGRLWKKLGICMLPAAVAPMLFVIGRGEGMIGIVGGVVCFLETAVLVLSIIPVEKALKENFDEDGKRKNSKAV